MHLAVFDVEVHRLDPVGVGSKRLEGVGAVKGDESKLPFPVILADLHMGLVFIVRLPCIVPADKHSTDLKILNTILI